MPRLRIYDGVLVAPGHASVLCLYLGFISKRDAATVSLFSLIVSFMRPVLIPLGQIKLKFATQIQLRVWIAKFIVDYYVLLRITYYL